MDFCTSSLEFNFWLTGNGFPFSGDVGLLVTAGQPLFALCNGGRHRAAPGATEASRGQGVEDKERVAALWNQKNKDRL